MTPGHYVQLRRRAFGLGPVDVEQLVAIGQVPLSANLVDIESGTAALTLADAALIVEAIDLDIDVLVALAVGEPVRLCLSCGCSEYDPCVTGCFGTCCWTGPVLCSSCPQPSTVAKGRS